MRNFNPWTFQAVDYIGRSGRTQAGTTVRVEQGRDYFNLWIGETLHQNLPLLPVCAMLNDLADNEGDIVWPQMAANSFV